VKGKVTAKDAKALVGTTANVLGGTACLTMVGEDLMLNTKSKIIQTDIPFKNGIIHVIDTVVMSSELCSPFVVEPSLVDVAIRAGYGTFVTAASAVSGLPELLMSGDEDYTIFVPSEAAFAKIPSATLTSLLEGAASASDPLSSALANILKLHVVKGKVTAKDAKALVGTTANVLGGTACLTMVGEDLMLNTKSKIIQTDIPFKNGIIHVIDTVVMESEECSR